MQSPQIAALLDDPASLDEFWQRVTIDGTPLIEPWRDGSRLVTFLWRGQAGSTRVWWGLDFPLERMPGTDLWYATRVQPSDLLTIYCITHDGSKALPTHTHGSGESHVDPFNPHRQFFPGEPGDPDDPDAWLSVLSLPDAPGEPWLEPRPGVAAGTIVDAPLSPPVAVYRPAGIPTEGLPVLVVFDGWIARVVQHTPTILDNLIAAGEIAPVVALFVSNYSATRDEELTPGSEHSRFITDELLPWARTELGAGADGRANVIAGVSRGGLAAAGIALRSPELFGGVISQSGSFWWPSENPGGLMREVAQRPPADIRFYLDVGILETMAAPGGGPNQIDVNRSMRDALRQRGYSVSYAEYSGGHDYVNWRRTFVDGLIAVAGVHAS
ncbi:alpha/beta hydrolase-fold protein [Actinoplanes sp. TRM 88003]|uniref:Alpha/beta hydrolase-fold protein n=1 Tax=Paractinoplanes aksuensis TaxID=2939490 RepID=A0ABT1DYJ6_9ACTN|nr:alpha/beta hydrolase-fold protein [Actinoplanes aksuensis]MCO8275942.1 alpha/beta hydrolase-fold protein [Actinoplanes aksuensis]